MDSRPHYRFDTFFTVHTKTFENDRIASCDVSITVTNTCASDIFHHRFHFEASGPINDVVCFGASRNIQQLVLLERVKMGNDWLRSGKSPYFLHCLSFSF